MHHDEEDKKLSISQWERKSTIRVSRV
jgi:hypothetical protein